MNLDKRKKELKNTFFTGPGMIIITLLGLFGLGIIIFALYDFDEPFILYDFISKHGRYDYGIFVKKYSLEPKEFLHTPETLILYFTDKVPEWAEVGMEVIY
jgi:hypothetical protein